MNATIGLSGTVGRTRPSGSVSDVLLRVTLAASLATSGYIHAHLYVGGYRFVHVVGALFLVQAAGSFAVALLVLIGAPTLMRLAAGGLAAGALAGFALSRTVGVFGFTERGWQPAPDSLVSVLVEVGTVLLILVGVLGPRSRPAAVGRLPAGTSTP